MFVAHKNMSTIQLKTISTCNISHIPLTIGQPFVVKSKVLPLQKGKFNLNKQEI